MASVVGLFDHYQDADRAVNSLLSLGYSNSDISVVTTEDNVQRRGASDVTTTTVDADGATHGGPTDTGDVGATGAATGAVGGAALGGIGGLLVGLGALAIPGIGPVIAGGTIAAALGSAAVGAGIGAAAGGLIGALVDIGVPEDQAQYYAEGIRRGGILVAVQTPDTRQEEVRNLFQEVGAVDIETRANEWKQSGWDRYDQGDNDLRRAV